LLVRRRRIGVWPLAATIFFIVCGGPYTTEQVVGKSGPICGLLMLCILPLVWSLPVGLLTAELSSKLPDEGGYYVWVKTAFGPGAGFLCAWWSWASSWVDLALYPLLAVEYASRATGGSAHPYWWIFGLIAGLTLWNLLGIKSVGGLSNILLIVVLLPFLAIVGFGLVKWTTHPPHAPFLNPKTELSGIGAALVFSLWNYFGWDSVTSALGEIEDARRTVPKAMVRAILIVTGLVVLPVAAGIALKTDWPNWDTDSGYWPEIASAAWPPRRMAVIVGGVVSNIGMFNANLLASSRIPVVLAKERYLPKVFGLEHRRFGTPWVGILFAGGLSALLARDSFEKLVAIDLSLYLVALMLECAALIALRKKLGRSPDSFEVGGGKVGLWACAVLPIVIGIVAIGLQLSPSNHLADTSVNPIFLFLALVVTGPLVYCLVRLSVSWRRAGRQ
jgi:amino acid transporter